MEKFFSDIAQQSVLDFWLLREGIQMRKPYDDSGFWFVDTFCLQQNLPKEEEPKHSMMVLLSWVENLSSGSLSNWNLWGRILEKRELCREQTIKARVCLDFGIKAALQTGVRFHEARKSTTSGEKIQRSYRAGKHLSFNQQEWWGSASKEDLGKSLEWKLLPIGCNRLLKSLALSRKIWPITRRNISQKKQTQKC